ncbi:efflux RND transporter permease subunit [Halobacteriovorax sp. HLS]|uniref:efflux RND transporter permease subunit n=1 Tax=Halobacteriovorax sp. HLS TaxID=2234000 RepID=UPI000FDA33A8|nr:efflux RND transporter permease subunit [Halobacteriovorax sp. HLS]
MKNITLYFIKRPILVNFILALNFIIGGYFIYKVPKEAFPGVSMNQIVIVTKYPGASAKDVELNVTAKLEEKIAEIGNIKESRSSSIESVSRVTIFADDDLNELQFKDLLSDVQTEVDKIDDFPSDIEGQPIITSVTTEDRPIMEVAFSGDYDHLKKTLHEIENDLRKVSGVSNVTLVGLPDEEIHIEVDAQKAQDKEIDLNSIYFAINTRNQVGTGGTLESFLSQKKVVSFNKYEKAEDVLNTVIRMSPDGQGVYLSDVAEINYRPKDEKLIVRNNGSRGASILVAIRSGVDQLKVSDKIKDLLKNYTLPNGVSYKLNNDVSDNARSKFSLLKNNGLIGFTLVLILLLYFLGGKPAFWTAFGIPFTVFGSMIMFVPMGMTLNSVSMGAFVIVLGMIVDDAMVISERFDVNVEKGQTPEEAAANAVGRLWRPVLAASLTTITAFMPLLSLGGLPGKFIWQMPVVVMMALFVSLIDCYLLLPAHLAHGASKRGQYKKSKIVLMWESLYERLLSKLIDYRYFVTLGFALILGLSVFVGATKVRKDSFPQEASEGFTIKATLKKGYAPEKVEEIISGLEKSIQSLKENELVGYTTRIGTHSLSSLTSLGTEENLVAFIVYLTPFSERDKTAQGIVDQLRDKHLNSYRERGYELEFDLLRIGPPLGEPFEIIVSSNNNENRGSSSLKVANFLKTISGVSDVKDDQIQGKDEINLKLNYKKVAQAGLTPVDIIRTLRIAFDGQIVTDYSSINDSYDFRLRLNKKSRGDFDFISNLPIANKRGQLIKLNTMIEYEQRESFAEIKHFNGLRSTSITGNINTQQITAVEMLKQFKEGFVKDKNVKYTISGRPVEEEKIFSGLKIAALLAVVGIYFILSLMFDSYAKPFLILTVIPFGVVGIFLSFFAHGLPISMFAGIGLIGLSGIVVNDSIVLVDHISQLLKENGKFSKEVLIQGAKERLRPISLTTVSTMLAVAPTAYAIGGYDPLLSPLSLAILYGLLFGTTVVLIFMPNMYVIGNDLGKVLNKFKGKQNATHLSILLIPLLIGLNVNEAKAQEKVNIRKIVELVENTNEYKIQNESIKQAELGVDSVDGLLDSKLTSKLFKYSSVNYPNPPISLDSEREGYGLSVDYEKMTSFGVKLGLGVGLEDKQLGTVPTNNQFSLDAMDTVYRATFAVPLWRNFGSEEYHLNKGTAVTKRKSQTLQSKSSKDKQVVEAIKYFWTIVKLEEEKAIAQESLKRFKAIHKLNVTKRKSGIISKAEFLTSEVEITNREKFLKDLESRIRTEKLNLQSILELESVIDIEANKMAASDHFKNATGPSALSLVESGLTYKQMQSNTELFNELVALENEKAKSNVDFFVSLKSFGRGDDLSNSISENTQDKHEVYAGITWDFDLGTKRNDSAVASSMSRKRQAEYRRDKTKFQLVKVVETLKEKVTSNQEQIVYLEKMKKQQFNILKAENKRFKNGRITTLDYVKLQEAYDRSSLQVISLKYLNELTALNLYFTVGKMDEYLKTYLEL